MRPAPEPPPPSGAPATRVRYLVLLWLCLAATIAYIHRGCLSVPATRIREELGLSTEQMGWVMGSFFWAYAAFQLPAGWMGDRWGTRRLLFVYAVTWSLATALMGLATGFVALLATRLANGAAQAGVFPCSVNTISKWFPATQRATPSGLLASFMSLGQVIGTGVTAYLLGLGFLSWQEVFVCLSLVGFVWAVFFHGWFRDYPREHSWVNAGEIALVEEGAVTKAGAPPEPLPWRTLLTSPQMLWICSQQFFRAAGLVFYQTWFPTLLQKTRGVSEVESGYLTMFPFVAIVVGSMLGGIISDWILQRTGSPRLSRQGLAIVNMLGCAALLAVAYPLENARLAVAVVTLSSFCAGVGGPAGYTITIDLGGRHVSTVFSTMNMAGNFGGALCPIVVPWLFGPDERDWNGVFLFLAAIYVAAAACWALVNPTRPIFADNVATPASPA